MADQNCKNPNFFHPTTPYRKSYRRKSAETICETCEAEYNEDMEHNEEMIRELMNTPNFQEDCLKFLNEKVLHDVQMNAGNKFSETFSTNTYKKYRDFFQLFERSPLESLLKP